MTGPMRATHAAAFGLGSVVSLCDRCERSTFPGQVRDVSSPWQEGLIPFAHHHLGVSLLFNVRGLEI